MAVSRTHCYTVDPADLDELIARGDAHRRHPGDPHTGGGDHPPATLTAAVRRR
jgi:hypothetical protein